MIGPEGAAAAVAAHLDAHLEAKLAELVTRLEPARPGKVERNLYVPKIVETFDVLDLPAGLMPALLVVAQGMTGLRRVEVAGPGDPVHAGSPSYAATYRLAIFAWAAGRTDGSANRPRGAEADLIRKRLVLAVREVLLDHLELEVTIGGRPDADPPIPATTVVGAIDETSIAEFYSLLNDEDHAAGMAAARTELTVDLEEAVPVTPAAPTTDTVVVDGELLPAHPALEP